MPRAIARASLLLCATLSAPACTSSSSAGVGGSASDYCAALSSYATKCNITDPCTTASIQQCSTTASQYSAAALEAVASCVNGATCGDAGTGAVSACIQQKEAAITPTATQTKLAQDYCAACPGPNRTPADCVAAFYGADAGLGGGIGRGLLGLSDAIATSVDTQCIPRLGADGGPFCALTFDGCYVGVLISSAKPPPACTGGAGFDAGAAGSDGG